MSFVEKLILWIFVRMKESKISVGGDDPKFDPRAS